jgi:SepF-like predicted cell division protein (DUF552 family)
MARHGDPSIMRKETMELMNTAVFKKYIPDTQEIYREGERVKSDVSFLNEMCERMQKSEHFTYKVVPVGTGKIIIDWYQNCWDDDFVLVHALFQSIRKCIVTDDDATFVEVAKDLKEIARHVGFDVVDATCDFIDCSWLHGIATGKLRSAMKN